MNVWVAIVKTVAAKCFAYWVQGEPEGEPVEWTRFSGGVIVAAGVA